MASRRIAVFVAYVVATVAHLAFVVAHEPFSFDAWNVAVDTRSAPITAGRFFAYWQYEYLHGNPRLGQPLSYLAYKLEGFAEVMTPLAYVGLTLAITILGLGRWPRRGRDFALLAIVIGFCWFVLPQLGRNMFSRAYGANYIYGAAIQLGVLAAIRLRVGSGTRATLEQLVTYTMLGAIAGLCNEHTGPALIVFLAGYAWWLRREDQEPRLVVAAGAGALLGFLALFLAPGQDERYQGLAQHASLVERVVDRGAGGSLEIFRDYLVYAAPLLGLLVLVVLLARVPRTEYRAAIRLTLLALAAGVVVAATLCASPKLGSRMFIAPLAVLLAGFLSVVDATTPSPRRLAPLVVLAVLASGYAAIRTIPLYRDVGAQGEARMAELAATTPGTVYIAEPFDQIGESWWFIGDDFRDPKKRAMVARYLALTRVSLRGGHGRRSPSVAPQPP
ncbi:MAG: DUF6056 family protein [Kofleriaceae bacterium]